MEPLLYDSNIVPFGEVGESENSSSLKFWTLACHCSVLRPTTTKFISWSAMTISNLSVSTELSTLPSSVYNI